MSFTGLGITEICSYCGTYCNYPSSSELVSMVEINKLRERYKDTKRGVAHKAECNCCGASTLRWVDEKIKCNYCGELV
ncbi:hypothetical protein LCGC14_2485090 [marine sediment metagenome]|uniref:Uncharacterized protein n=1 Tax=marine sediment metagenome TaxID=412755 RepID=A0A0F9BU89_9ZZZZ